MATVASVLDDIRTPANRVYGSATPVDSASGSGVSWGAIFGGAAAAAALSLILVVLGSGLGLTSISPWSFRGVSGETLGIAGIAWMCVTAVAASGLGGYLAGRLRTKWQTLHTDEVYFRDTAHGFLAWAVATLITAGVLVSAIGSIVGTGATAAGGMAAGAAATGAGPVALAPVAQITDGSRPTAAGPRNDSRALSPYALDSLFRTTTPSTAQSAGGNGIVAGGENNANDTTGGKPEAGRILANALRSGQLSQDDLSYAGHLVAQGTGLSQADAEKRVADFYNATAAKMRTAETEAKNVADQARKATAYAMLWIFVSLLLGAFSASLMATVGGRRRDLY